MTWYEAVIGVFTSVTDAVYHEQMLPRTGVSPNQYIVWMEEGDNDLEADNRHAERAVRGNCDLYTKIEFDPLKEQLEQAMEDSGMFAWRLNFVEHEDTTGYWHYEWVWTVFGFQGVNGDGANEL